MKHLLAERTQSPKEEVLNTWSAGFGLLLMIGAAGFLLAAAMKPGGLHVGSVAIFVVCLVFMHLASTLYHAVPQGRPAKAILQKFDHAAILLLIAGTYTPFLVGGLWSLGGRWLLVVQWTLAALGISLLLMRPRLYRKVSTIFYVGMGWAGIVLIPAVLQVLPTGVSLWMLAGGIAYTAGVIFYAAKQVPFFHGIWHVFVVAGSAMHTWAVYRYTLWEEL